VQIFKFVSCSQERFPEIKTRVPVSVKELFPVLNPQRVAGIFVLFIGCIDESGDAQNFALSGLISDGEGTLNRAFMPSSKSSWAFFPS